MMRTVLLTIVLLHLLFFKDVHGFKWLGIAMVASVNKIDQKEQCEHLTGLVKRQKKICKRNVEVMLPVKTGAEIAISECQWQFQHRRWNCSTVSHDTVFGKILNQGTRESAFVHAISSAGVAYAVTRACSEGILDTCGCDGTVQGKSPAGFQWAGCSDNIAYGTAFCRSFVDARERSRGKRSKRALMNLHNNEAGRKAVEDYMKVQCKCHGVSGSCEMKTCWRAMPSFRNVGKSLKDKFDGASEVAQKVVGTRKVLVPLNQNYKRHDHTDLVYLTPSPDYCEENVKRGAMGTRGRLCNPDSKAVDGCALLCCGRGYRSERRLVRERCRCKFHWCCHVKCDFCQHEREFHYCN